MKILLSSILFFTGVLTSNAQLESLDFTKRISITNNDPHEKNVTGVIVLNNQLVVYIDAGKNDRLFIKNNDNKKQGEEKFIDSIQFYGEHIKVQIIDKKGAPRGISANTLTGRFLQMSFDYKNNLMSAENLEYQINNEEQAFDSTNNWLPFNTLQQDSIGFKIYSNQVKNAATTGKLATIRIRLKDSKDVFSELHVIRKPLHPHKVMEFHYTADNQNYDRLLIMKDKFIQDADSVYQKQLQHGKANLPDSSTYQQDTRLMWFFGRTDKDLPDSSLRFSLLANGKEWAVREGITGHLLLLDNLKAGNDYTLKIWYALQPENSETYHFNLPPYWYNRPAIQLAGILLLLGLIFLIVKIILEKQNRKNTLRLQQAQNAFASVRAQLNPHFVFNALNSIQALMNTGNVDGANDYLSRFSKLLRTSLQPNYQGMVPLSTELELLQQYIELEQLRMPFTYTTQIKPTLDVHAIEIPGMLLQPLAENAIKHGLPGAADPKLICEVLVQQSNLVIAIKNNGHPLKENVDTGVGLKIIAEKLEILNRCFPDTNAKYQLSTINNLTTVTVTLHQWLK